MCVCLVREGKGDNTTVQQPYPHSSSPVQTPFLPSGINPIPLSPSPLTQPAAQSSSFLLPPSLPLMGEAVHSSHAPSCLNKNEFADRLSAYVSLSTSLPPPSPPLMPPLSASPHASHTLFLNPSLQETPRVRF